MFYPTELLQRSGALARVWMAANVEKKLTKAQVLQDKIDEDISEIMRPRAPFSLRLSGSLLLGVVRIYSRKARYLLDDASDALWKIKMVCCALVLFAALLTRLNRPSSLAISMCRAHPTLQTRQL